MVVETTLGAAFSVAAIPHAYVYGIDWRLLLGKRMAGEKPPQSLGVDPPSVQGGIKATPATTMRGLEAQVGGGRGGAVRAQDGVCELEEGIFSAVEAFVERAAEGAKWIGRRFHGAPIMHPPKAFCILCRPRS
jgi:hypothetical protein